MAEFKGFSKVPIENKIGKYTVISPIASGGMGRVYLAKEEKTNRLIAMKVLPDHFLKDRKRSQYLEREVRIARKLKHPNVIDIYGLYLQNGIGYLLMEYIDGGNLRQYVKDRSLGLCEALGLILKICAGLHYIHQHRLEDGRFHSIIHGDIKPENILVSKEGQVKVADFGLSMAEGFWLFRGLRARAGTPFYMSPEQIKGKPLDVRTDIYSLGLVIYELITGQLPYRVQDKNLYMKMVISKKSKPVPPSYINKKIPHQLDEITLRALENETSGRYQTVAQIMLDLQRLLPMLRPACDKAENFGMDDTGLFANNTKHEASADLNIPRPPFDEQADKAEAIVFKEENGEHNRLADAVRKKVVRKKAAGRRIIVDPSAEPRKSEQAHDNQWDLHENRETPPCAFSANADDSKKTAVHPSNKQEPLSAEKLNIKELEDLIFVNRKKG